MKLIIKMFFSSFKNRNHEIVEIFGSREKTKIVQDECKVCLSQWNLENEVLYLLVNENKKKVCRLLKKKRELFMGLNKHQEHVIPKLMIIWHKIYHMPLWACFVCEEKFSKQCYVYLFIYGWLNFYKWGSIINKAFK
jgi:hypothetical protein